VTDRRSDLNAARTIWLTGLPSAGKTTLARALSARLRDQGRASLLLDGDALRAGLAVDLGFSERDRAEQSRRAAEVARLANDAGVNAVVALISPSREDRLRARRIVGAGRLRIVWIHAPLTVCEARDPKGLYRRARAGLLRDFTGIEAVYEEPLEAALCVNTEHASVEACLENLWQLLSSDWNAAPETA
jgi:adenylyl-sulfate kinase